MANSAACQGRARDDAQLKKWNDVFLNTNSTSGTTSDNEWLVSHSTYKVN